MGQVIHLFPIAPRRALTAQLVDLMETAKDQGDDVAFDAIHEAWVRLQHAKLWRAREQAAKEGPLS